jgi:SAM-dependent methyltransferase
MLPASGPWNHNIHYHPLILDAIGPHCGQVLDVGCGEGILARELQPVAEHVTAIDLDTASIELARRSDPGGEIDYIVGDVLTYPFAPSSFDATVSIAALHHMDAEAGLKRMRELLRPGGTLAIVGLARSRIAADLPRELAAVLAHRMLKARYGYWDISAPTVRLPPLTYADMRRIAQRGLPGVRYRRHLLWRYSLVWTKPGR